MQTEYPENPDLPVLRRTKRKQKPVDIKVFQTYFMIEFEFMIDDNKIS